MIRLFHAYFPVRTLLLGVSEALLITVAFLLAAVVRFGGDTRLMLAYEHGSIKIALVAGVFVLCMYYFDLYDTLVLSNRREIVTRLVQVLGTGTVVLAVVYYAFPQARLGRGILVFGLLLVPVLVSSWRELFFWSVRSFQLTQRALIVGSGPLATALAHEVRQRAELGLDLVGYVDPSGGTLGVDGLPCAGTADSLAEVVQRRKVDRIVVAMTDRRGKLPLDTLLALKTKGVQVIEGASMYEMATGRISLENLRPSWLLFSSGFLLSRPQLVYKRMFSLAGSLAGLIVAAPLMALIAVAIKLESKGPIIFRQQRVGQDGKVFTLYKFRSMQADADADGKPRPARENDDRFTRVGRWLRRARVDELPQLYNILKGDMHFVGPRPFVPDEEYAYARQIPFYTQRWSVKPGATGWAQVQRGYCASLEDNKEKLSYDLFYIKNMSPGLDFLILFQTAKILLLGRGGR